jgi:beta-N-acetylglucosaminidase
MIHTSIRIPEELHELVVATGRSTSAVARDALASYFEIDLTKKGKSTLADMIQDQIDKSLEEHVKNYTHVREESTPQDMANSEEVARALEVIQTWHSEGKEPTVAQVAKEIGIYSQVLGRLLKEHGIVSKHTKRKGKSGHYILIGSVPEIQ